MVMLPNLNNGSANFYVWIVLGNLGLLVFKCHSNVSQKSVFKTKLGIRQSKKKKQNKNQKKKLKALQNILQHKLQNKSKVYVLPQKCAE